MNIEDLKCCGNCKNVIWGNGNEQPYCETYNFYGSVVSWNSCPKWESDSRKSVDREYDKDILINGGVV